MRADRRDFLRGFVTLVAASTLPMLPRWSQPVAAAPLPPPAASPRMTVPTRPHGAQLQACADWTELLPGQPVRQVFAPSSGALLAATDSELLRSDDAGGSWRALPLPNREPRSLIEVDPTNHDTLYAATAAGLQRSTDAGATWTTILPPTLPAQSLAVSPADTSVLYVAQFDASRYQFQRSLDGGMTWEPLEDAHSATCVFGVRILGPHPTDSSRLFRTTGCYAGRDVSDSLEQSRNHGSSFQVAAAPRFAFPGHLVGGSGADPLRFYLAANKDFREGGSLLLVSTDDAATWSTVLEHVGGGTMRDATSPSTIITGLAYDPAAPERVFLAQRERIGSDEATATHSVLISEDSGATWTPLGRAPLPEVRQLVLGIDGRNLFAATANGLLGIALA